MLVSKASHSESAANLESVMTSPSMMETGSVKVKIGGSRLSKIWVDTLQLVTDEKINSLFRDNCWQKTRIDKIANEIMIGGMDSFHRYRGTNNLSLNIKFEN